MADSKTQPIIIKKIKKGGGGHHGGAWKVAYADFVTAMMAFFLLLWLLSSTSEEQKQGIAEFFTPTIGLKDAKGIGVKGGKAKTVDGSSQNDKTPSGLVVGRTASGPIIQVPEDQQKKSKEDDGSPESKGKVSEGEEIHAKEKQAEGEVGGNADQELFDQAAQIPPENIVWVDETGIEERLLRVHAGSSRGTRALGDVSGKRVGRTTLIAGYGAGILKAPMRFKGYTNTNVFNTWAEEVLAPELTASNVVIMDSASFHKSRAT